MLQFSHRHGRENLTNSDRQDNLTAAEVDQKVYLCLYGRGSFRISPSLKTFIMKKIENSDLTHIYLNMNNCEGMDSTFMGVLAGLACLIKTRPHLSFQLTHLSKKNEALLITLGVNRVLDYRLDTDTENPDEHPQPQLELSIETDTKVTAETSLEAHQKLVDIDAKNHLEFKSVIELLQADLDQLHGD